jgi:dTDP-glucose pyrophosphorylase
MKDALEILNKLAKDAIIFVIDKDSKLLGSITDGDVRRGFLKGYSLENAITDFIQPNPKFIRKSNNSLNELINLREKNFRIIPVLNKKNQIVNVINFRYLKSYLPLDAVIMAGGKGTRLRPMTESVPKPLLKVGDKAIIDYGMEHLMRFGVDDFWISVNYLGDQIIDHFNESNNNGINIKFILEDQPLGTIGAIRNVSDFQHDFLLVTNSDILTNINYEDFFLDFLEKDADMAIVSIPYQVNVPYAVLETSDHQILSFSEKPTYTYYSNGGIYLMKRSVVDRIPQNSFYNSTDLMQDLLEDGKKVISYPLRQYWLDIGKIDDFNRAQEDIKHITF